jgi:hypothetical protein
MQIAVAELKIEIINNAFKSFGGILRLALPSNRRSTHSRVILQTFEIHLWWGSSLHNALLPEPSFAKDTL